MARDQYRIIYFSRALRGFDPSMLAVLERRAAAANALVGVTGILLYDGDRFLQVLEGDRAAVETVMARIAADPRHDSITFMERAPTGRVHFDGWGMTVRRVDAAADFLAAAKAEVDVVDDARLRAAVIGFAAIGGRAPRDPQPHC